MILFGHSLVPSERIYHIDSIEAILHTPSNSIIAIDFSKENMDIIEHAKSNRIRFALFIKNQVEAVIGENLGATYLIINAKNGNPLQIIADFYLFNAKVLGYCEFEEKLQDLIDMRFDGAVFDDAIVRVGS